MPVGCSGSKPPVSTDDELRDRRPWRRRSGDHGSGRRSRRRSRRGVFVSRLNRVELCRRLGRPTTAMTGFMPESTSLSAPAAPGRRRASEGARSDVGVGGRTASGDSFTRRDDEHRARRHHDQGAVNHHRRHRDQRCRRWSSAAASVSPLARLNQCRLPFAVAEHDRRSRPPPARRGRGSSRASDVRATSPLGVFSVVMRSGSVGAEQPLRIAGDRVGAADLPWST